MFVGLFLNATIEERVTLLEIQVAEVDERVGLLEGDVNFLFDEQVIQDERILILEQDSDVFDEDLESECYLNLLLWISQITLLSEYIYNQNIMSVDLQDTTLALDFRVTVLEENGGGDGNSSVADLEVRVETLEGTAADHETRISAVEADVNGSVTCVGFFPQ